jgi:aspartyl/asparaginyl beta-hydroxylase (cupin superfamily)
MGVMLTLNQRVADSNTPATTKIKNNWAEIETEALGVGSIG